MNQPLTERRDAWWVEPLVTVVVLVAFGVYAFWVALINRDFAFGPYLSPFYSPHLDLAWWPFSPAFLILWVPLGFRLTCYYYRRSYYRAFFWDPPACAVGEMRRSYRGERSFPFVLNNLHRYFWYLSLPVLAFLWYDAIKAFFWEDGFHVGLGALILVVNVVLLSYYTFSCHAWRHLAGGCLDCMSGRPVRYGLWRWTSRINARHGYWAWVSMVSVALADAYIRLCATGAIADLRLF
ncbi:hypothetical protein Mterra_03841 [Calidithermus terrae]|uniref:Succinate dehydrogenase n=1 Tax=Calidithermus terrae TaxID=1408545 RepID=A0A399E467_9DEIN|nr:succinate dehydrogenase [Calidithermus terrae]RIH76762.1 hypothetical protein Mterra_03841 [Calidithermus terrae]